MSISRSIPTTRPKRKWEERPRRDITTKVKIMPRLSIQLLQTLPKSQLQIRKERTRRGETEKVKQPQLNNLRKRLLMNHSFPNRVTKATSFIRTKTFKLQLWPLSLSLVFCSSHHSNDPVICKLTFFRFFEHKNKIIEIQNCFKSFYDKGFKKWYRIKGKVDKFISKK